MVEFSVVTIVKGRRKQLANLLDAIKASTILPYDIQIVCMDNLDGITSPDGLNVSIQIVSDPHKLPLAAARNMGISATKTNNIVFIDVDCLVSPSLFTNMLMALQTDNIIAAYPLYLPIVPENGNYSELKHKAVPHPSRELIPVGISNQIGEQWKPLLNKEVETILTSAAYIDVYERIAKNVRQ